jgi:hypothetical protein
MSNERTSDLPLGRNESDPRTPWTAAVGQWLQIWVALEQLRGDGCAYHNENNPAQELAHVLDAAAKLGS